MADTLIPLAALFVGVFVGVVVMAILRISSDTSFDTERLDWLAHSKCDAFKTDTGWMVVNPHGHTVGHAHRTLRNAIDHARATQ